MSGLFKSFGTKKDKKDDKKEDKKDDKTKTLKKDGSSSSKPETKEEDLDKPHGKLVVNVSSGRGFAPTSANVVCVVSFERNQTLSKTSDGATPKWDQSITFDVTDKGRDLTIECYSRGASGNELIGSVRIQPSYGDQASMTDQWYRLRNKDNTADTAAELHVVHTYKHTEATRSLTINDFDLLKVIGKGSFGKVMQVRKKDTNRIYAMKILKKSHLVERDEVGHTKSERIILAKNCSPFLVGLKFSFQTPEKIYLVLDYVNGGELFFHLQNEGKFSEQRSKFYTAQLLSALESLHAINVIYRDLKPENILVDFDGFIALTDFGLCKEEIKHDEKTNTFCGTPEYMAPEVLQQKGYGPSVDWWTLGILLYEMLTGLPPFYDENTNQMYHKILFGDLVFTDEISPKARSLIAGLLDRDPAKRLGAGPNGAKEIKQHAFFEDMNFADLEAKRVPVPWKPSLENQFDTSNFDPEFTEMQPQDSVVPDSHLSATVQNQFKGFTYVDHSEALQGAM
ncbi:serine/threonine-protein kinase gad8 [Capsaspora owczarzaki ATCC 30864]|uniref:non-specific serine/threonine protein kinase n=1 Tax=Capsaspora owczarzaki (strain ATCC 30864) TaxID=595528 RepID=A0A0D2U679_CAPO3|nr:serine/threonine-protein kinase gad8 [Capsaspora owczarzaki ATCC 30864]KJE90626.1 AGC/AKT protein kinase [Capsaspora owczarzaki ATCC 30864]|eukprot:XP_004364779.2 serine/threonine-protein kinase gad8 [Capsaspora owczarzaki ATCC 30864]